jgi:cytidylate kinase
VSPEASLREQNASLPPDTVVAIDGPAGSGKSTTARELARRLDLTYVDTGAMYRALTWAGLAAGLASKDGPALARLLRESRLELRPGGKEASVFWDGRDVSRVIRTPEIDAAVSAVSAHAAVRHVMVERQRDLGRRVGVVMEGRDIGTAVFPLASAKIYLDASLEARVERRLRQYRQRGTAMAAAELQEELADRDRRDSEREESPLSIAPDAVVLDSSNWTLEHQVDQALQAVRSVVAEHCPAGHRPVAPPTPLTAKYRLAYSCMEALARFYGLRVVGREHLDWQRGPTIIACNHVSWWDPPLLGGALWRSPVRTLAKAELFRYRPLAAFFGWLDAIPIRRAGYDHGAFAAALEALNSGQTVLIFPEGTRRPLGRPGPVRSGLGNLMQHSGAPAVPAFMRGTRLLQPGSSPLSPLEVRFAPAVRLRALPTLLARHNSRTVSGLVASLFEAIYVELQARSWLETPPSAWEREEGARQRRAYRDKEHRVFGRKRAPEGSQRP